MRRSLGCRAAMGMICLMGIGLADATPAHAAIVHVTDSYDAAPNAQTPGGLSCGLGGGTAISAGIGGLGAKSSATYVNSIVPVKEAGVIFWEFFADNYSGVTVERDMELLCDNAPKPGQYRIRKSARIDVPDAAQKSGTASCRNDEIVVGGGVSNSALASEGVDISSTGPMDDGDRGRTPEDGWRGAAINSNDPANQSVRMHVYAVCDTKRSLRKVDYRSDTVTIPDAEELGTVPVHCREGETVIGGGVIAHASYRHFLYLSGTDPRPFPDNFPFGWDGAGYNFPSADGKARDFTTTAICL